MDWVHASFSIAFKQRPLNHLSLALILACFAVAYALMFRGDGDWCRHVVLVSADKDGYVPPQSARIQMCDASIRDAKREVPHGQVRSTRLTRLRGYRATTYVCMRSTWLGPTSSVGLKMEPRTVPQTAINETKPRIAPNESRLGKDGN